MRYVKWTFLILIWTLVLAVLHYTLPQWDIVRITDTYETRINPGENSLFWTQANTGNSTVSERDVFFIQARKAGGDVIVYRNEDTGWGWPPYFKFDTANLQAEASDFRSTAQQPVWLAVKHYGWRMELISIFPNAVTIRQVDGPDARVIPWVSIIVLVLLAATWWAIRVRWLRFWEKRVEPAIETVTDRL